MAIKLLESCPHQSETQVTFQNEDKHTNTLACMCRIHLILYIKYIKSL